MITSGFGEMLIVVHWAFDTFTRRVGSPAMQAGIIYLSLNVTTRCTPTTRWARHTTPSPTHIRSPSVG